MNIAQYTFLYAYDRHIQDVRLAIFACVMLVSTIILIPQIVAAVSTGMTIRSLKGGDSNELSANWRMWRNRFDNFRIRSK